MSSTELFEAASISTTSSEVPVMIARQFGSSGSKSAFGPVRGVQGAGQELGHRRLAGAARAHEQVGVMHLLELDRVPERADDVLLADHLVEGARAVAAVRARALSRHPSHAAG